MTVPDIALVYDNAFEHIKIFIYSGVRSVFVIRTFVCGILRGVEELFRVDPHVQLVIDGERNFTVELVRHGRKRGVIDHPALEMYDEQSRQRIAGLLDLLAFETSQAANDIDSDIDRRW